MKYKENNLWLQYNISSVMGFGAIDLYLNFYCMGIGNLNPTGLPARL
jgi:hypothetical protein